MSQPRPCESAASCRPTAPRQQDLGQCQCAEQVVCAPHSSSQPSFQNTPPKMLLLVLMRLQVCPDPDARGIRGLVSGTFGGTPLPLPPCAPVMPRVRHRDSRPPWPVSQPHSNPTNRRPATSAPPSFELEITIAGQVRQNDTAVTKIYNNYDV